MYVPQKPNDAAAGSYCVGQDASVHWPRQSAYHQGYWNHRASKNLAETERIAVTRVVTLLAASTKPELCALNYAHKRSSAQAAKDVRCFSFPLYQPQLQSSSVARLAWFSKPFLRGLSQTQALLEQ